MADAVDGLENVTFHGAHLRSKDVRSEVLASLQQPQKTLAPKWLYDERGSELFEAITRQPEYYLTRTEVEILTKNRQSIRDLCGEDCILIEPGSGNCEKVQLLFEALQPAAYVPLDISEDFLQKAALDVGRAFPEVQVHAICADFHDEWPALPELPHAKRICFYPGSTIGNLEPAAARHFLGRVRELVGDRGGMLVGVDLHKPSHRLHAAYNDAEGLTARFNLNALRHVSAVLDVQFDPERFSHRAFYDETHRRIEMHLVCQEAHALDGDGFAIHFSAGETIHTESSYKYTNEDFAALAESAGFSSVRSFCDDDNLFSVHYLRAA